MNENEERRARQTTQMNCSVKQTKKNMGAIKSEQNYYYYHYQR